MELISKEFLEEYLKTKQIGLSESERKHLNRRLAKEFQKELPETYDCFLTTLSILKTRDSKMNSLAEQLGGLMFDMFRDFYGGFSQPERKGRYLELAREAVRITLTWEPESGVGQDEQTSITRNFIKQNLLMALLLLKVEAVTKGYPQGRPYFSQIFIHLSVLAAQLNELVGMAHGD